MHLCGHLRIKFLWSCDTRAQDSFSLFKSTQCFQKHVLLSICAFIRVYFGCSGKLSQHSPFMCIHIFQKLIMIIENFCKEKLKIISFQKHVGFFLARPLIIIFLFFFLFFLFLSYYHLFISSPFSFSLFLSGKVVRTRAHTTYLRLITR